MRKDDLVYAGHMLDQARRAMGLIQGKNRNDYDHDESLRLALTHLLQIVGEAARRISEDFRLVHPEIPWRAAIGMRHKVVHDYMDVDEEIVWDTVRDELPSLIVALEEIVPEEE